MKTTLKKAFAIAVAAFALAAFAEPSVEITDVKISDVRDGTVEYTYTVSGDFGGLALGVANYDLIVTASAAGGTKSAVVKKTSATLGTKTETVNVKTLLGKAYPAVSFSAKLIKGVQLWEDGPYWAECNVGARKPEEHGYYFWWGDTLGYVWGGSYWVGSDWLGGDYPATYFYSSTPKTSAKSITQLYNNGYIDANSMDGKLNLTRDAARAHLGAPWRMPTKAELEKLADPNFCTTTWTTLNGVKGRKVTGKGTYASNSIFLPGVGEAPAGSRTSYLGSSGFYWSSTLTAGTLTELGSNAWNLQFDDSKKFSVSAYTRSTACPVRAVQ